MEQLDRGVAVAVFNADNHAAHREDSGEIAETLLVAVRRVLFLGRNQLVVVIQDKFVGIVQQAKSLGTVDKQRIHLFRNVEAVFATLFRPVFPARDGEILHRPADDVRARHAFVPSPEIPETVHVLDAVPAGKVDCDQGLQDAGVAVARTAFAPFSEVFSEQFREAAPGKGVENVCEAAESGEFVVLCFYIDRCRFEFKFLFS